MARHLGKSDEAIQQYSAYLKLDPDGDHAKSAQHELNELQTKAAAAAKK
jgi:hypothetical protein